MPVFRRLWTYGAIVVISLLATSCVGLPTESTWGDISLIGDTPNILLSFGDRIAQINPTDGSLVELLDAQGKVRVDEDDNPRPWQVQGSGNPALHFYTRPIRLDDNTLLTAVYEDKLFEIDVPRAEIDNPSGIALPGHIVANPLLTDNFLYVPLSEGGLLALNPSDYSEIWRFTAENSKGMWSPPLLVDDTLYISSMNHFLYALNPETGEMKWEADLEGAIASTPAFANNALYVGSFAHKLFKVDLDGTIAAEYPTNEWVWGPPQVVDDMVYATDLGGYVYALRDAGSSFEEVWSRKVAGGAIRSTPLVTADTIIVGSRDHNVYWLGRETGEELIKREMRGEVLSDILLLEPNDTIREPLIIVSTLANEERLVAFSLDRGERRWVYGV